MSFWRRSTGAWGRKHGSHPLMVVVVQVLSQTARAEEAERRLREVDGARAKAVHEVRMRMMMKRRRRMMMMMTMIRRRGLWVLPVTVVVVIMVLMMMVVLGRARRVTSDRLDGLMMLTWRARVRFVTGGGAAFGGANRGAAGVEARPGTAKPHAGT
jgi:hypothetical protein